jgi:hypothetical protein
MHQHRYNWIEIATMMTASVKKYHLFWVVLEKKHKKLQKITSLFCTS